MRYALSGVLAEMLVFFLLLGERGKANTNQLTVCDSDRIDSEWSTEDTPLPVDPRQLRVCILLD